MDVDEYEKVIDNCKNDENYFENNEESENYTEIECNEINSSLNDTECEIINIKEENISFIQNNTKNEINDISDDSENILNEENLVTKKVDQYNDTEIHQESEEVDKSKYDPNMEELIDELNNLNLYDPKIDVIFKSIFGRSNEDLAKSLINSILVHEDEIEKLSFNSENLLVHPLDKNKKVVIVDLHLRNESGKRSYLIEMQIHEKYDMILRAEFSIYRLINEIIESGSKFIIDEKICSINFIYYYMFTDNKFYHRLIRLEGKDSEKINETIEYNNKSTLKVNEKNDNILNETNDLQLKNKNYHKNEIIIIELRKFRKMLDKNAIEKLVAYSDEVEKMKKNIKEKEENSRKTEEEIKEIEIIKNIAEKKERKLKLHLWLAFLSKINTVYEDNPNSNSTNVIVNEYGREIKTKKKIVRIRNEITLELYKLFKKYDEIMKAIKICQAPLDENKKSKFIEYVTRAEEFAMINKILKEKLQKKDLENKRQREELQKKDLENKRQREELQKKDLENKRQKKELEKNAIIMKNMEDELRKLKELINQNQN